MADPFETTFTEALELESRRWFNAILPETGPLALFDTHTHIGQHDPDGFKQTPEELLAVLDRADGARALTFPMCEPDGYPPANDAVRAVAEASEGRLRWLCRVDPHADPVVEARRCLDLGADGIKLHPRAEQFGMGEPNVEKLVALADERRAPVLIHAGRGIPALGRDTVRLAGRYPDAKLILAHAAVSDLVWLTRVMPSHPNLFIDTSWWNPADLLALFSLVPPDQILWASDSPYGDPVTSAAFQFRYALAAGLDRGAIRSVAGGQIERILNREDPVDLGPPPGAPESLDLELERVYSHLLNAVGRALAEGDPTESVELARLALDPEGDNAALYAEVLRLISLYDAHRNAPWKGHVFTGASQFLMMALAVVRTPGVGLPGQPADTDRLVDDLPD